ncbi:MAG: hypothetical protein JL50_14205 [Peptococcaceae bacterium BICA1-7]|nr:MAG: hypothetical protein JL50_14205 [Peptococcaceae bacterium BICA1-7]HBV96406.1 hybrid sensor histidine kinase/response regulator [Desulfotomaculum sp.]
MFKKIVSKPVSEVQNTINSMRAGVRLKLMAVVLVALLLLVVKNLYFDYWHALDRNKAQVGKSFSLLGDMLENDILRWIDNRENDVSTMADNPLVRKFAGEVARGSGNSTGTAEELQRYWEKIMEQYGVYDEIYISDIAGKILVSTDSSRINSYRPADNLIIEPLRTGAIYFNDAYLSPATKKPCIAFSIPVRAEEGGAPDGIACILVYRIDIQSVIQPLLEGTISLGNTGELVLLNKQGIAINELRFRPGSALRYQLKSEPALRVVQGDEGIAQGIGYNGEEMISVYRYIPKVSWGLIIRQETNELFGPLRGDILNSLFISMAWVLLVLGILLYFLNRMIKPLNSMEIAAREIAGGDFSRRVAVNRRDEIGRLGNSLNYMASEMGRQFKNQKNTQEVLKVLVSTLDLDRMLEKGLHTICTSYNFNVGAIFLADPEKGEYASTALYCPGQKLMDPKRVIRPGEGIEGLAAITGKIQVVSDLPEDTVYTVNWLGGQLAPANIVVIPLLFGKEVLGVMSLSSLNKNDHRQTEELETVGTLVGVAVNNAIMYKKALDLSVQLKEANEQLAQQNEELSTQSEELMSQAEELQMQSEELQTTTRKLQYKNTELERLADQKTRFLAGLSHELRAPLNAVISFSDVLLDKVVGELNQQQERYLHEILNSGQHLLNLINDLLDLSKIEVGRVDLNIRELDLSIPLEEALAMVGADVSRKRLEVTNLVNAGDCVVVADKGKLKQIFLNLLTNAVKFTPVGGKLTIGSACDGPKCRIWVADTGIGISPEYHDAIFEEFNQVGSKGPGQYTGTGLGLSITKKLIELQGGVIHVQSGEGVGATFIFTLPLSEKNSVLRQSVDCNLKCSYRDSCENCSCPRSKITYLPKPLVKNALLESLDIKCCLVDKPLLVLVIDDDPAVRSFVPDILIPRGYGVITAGDGLIGVQLALAKKPDIIILDIVMPGKDGFEVLMELSGHCWEKGLSIFICTSKDLSREEKQVLEQRFQRIFNPGGQ